MNAQGSAQPRSAARVVLRALGSTVIVAVVAFLLSELRFGRFRLSDFELLIVDHWKLFVALFGALAVWDYWFWRTSRGGGGLTRSREDPED